MRFESAIIILMVLIFTAFAGGAAYFSLQEAVQLNAERIERIKETCCEPTQ